MPEEKKDLNELTEEDVTIRIEDAASIDTYGKLITTDSPDGAHIRFITDHDDSENIHLQMTLEAAESIHTALSEILDTTSTVNTVNTTTEIEAREENGDRVSLTFRSEDENSKIQFSKHMAVETADVMLRHLEHVAREKGDTITWYDPPDEVEEDLPPMPDDEQEDIQDTATD